MYSLPPKLITGFLKESNGVLVLASAATMRFRIKGFSESEKDRNKYLLWDKLPIMLAQVVQSLVEYTIICFFGLIFMGTNGIFNARTDKLSFISSL